MESLGGNSVDRKEKVISLNFLKKKKTWYSDLNSTWKFHK